ncbi:MAG: hypothetical protein R3F30_07660 [Planctomycetota bacterium]
MNPKIAAIGCALVLASPVRSQHQASLEDLKVVRHRTYAVDQFLEVRGGALYGFADGEDPVRYVENSLVFDGSAYLRTKNPITGQGRLDAYVGRDGFYGSIIDGDPKTAKNYTRFEVFGRQWASFIREGFYQGDDFIPVGMYDYRWWKARMLLAANVTEGLKGEMGVFYGQNAFDRNGQTSGSYTIPDDHAVYGFEVLGEENRLEVDPATRLPYKGYTFSGWITQEWNDSQQTFGIVGRESRLPKSLIRGGAHFEYYMPASDTTSWFITGDGMISPKDDRITIYDPWKTQGRWWIDGTFELRWLLGDHFSLQPGVRVQYLRLADEFGTSEENKFFWGGQVRTRWDPSESVAVVTEQCIHNESREPVELGQDTQPALAFAVPSQVLRAPGRSRPRIRAGRATPSGDMRPGSMGLASPSSARSTSHGR